MLALQCSPCSAIPSVLSIPNHPEGTVRYQLHCSCTLVQSHQPCSAFPVAVFLQTGALLSAHVFLQICRLAPQVFWREATLPVDTQTRVSRLRYRHGRKWTLARDQTSRDLNSLLQTFSLSPTSLSLCLSPNCTSRCGDGVTSTSRAQNPRKSHS